MVGINPRLAQNYSIQPQKVATQNGNENQQTQQAETKAVKQPTVPTLQQPKVKVPLETLQLNAGITIGGSTNISEAKPMADIFVTPDEFIALLQGDKPLVAGDRIFLLSGNKQTIVFEVTAVNKNSLGKYEYDLRQL